MPFPKHQNVRLTLRLPQATVVRWRLGILQSLISVYLFRRPVRREVADIRSAALSRLVIHEQKPRRCCRGSESQYVCISCYSARRPASSSCSIPNLISPNVTSVVKISSPRCAVTNSATAAAGFGLQSSDTMLVSRSQPLTGLRRVPGT